MALDVELAEIRDFLAAHAPFDSLPPVVLESIPAQLSIGYHRRGTVVLDGHAVRGRCTGEGLTPGTRVRVRLEEADVVGRTVRFSLVEAP